MSDPNAITPNPNPAPPPATEVTVAAPKATVTKPAVATDPNRRNFMGTALAVLGSGWVSWTAFTAAVGAMTIGTVRFMLPNVLSEPPSKFKAGFPDSYEDGKVVERFKDQNTWIVRDKGVIYALSTTCTHLGCTPNWLEREGKFKCPCHGSGFYMSGINFEGPAPRPLERWAVRIGEDGQIVVDKSMKFQHERGDWSNPESFIKV